MELALKEAKKAASLDEVPIGCLIVQKGKIIAKSYNRKSLDNIATYHAEILAIESACKQLGTWYLDDCTLYTTVEPCMMCTGAIIQSRIPKVVYGATNQAFGHLSKIETKIEIINGVLEKQCCQILTEFFQKKRIENKL
jgi:tRNA(adenine34) deaminase